MYEILLHNESMIETISKENINTLPSNIVNAKFVDSSFIYIELKKYPIKVGSVITVRCEKDAYGEDENYEKVTVLQLIESNDVLIEIYCIVDNSYTIGFSPEFVKDISV